MAQIKENKSVRFLKNCKTQSNKRLLGLAVFIFLANTIIHFELWYHNIWNPLALFSLLLFYFVWFQYNTEHRKAISKKAKQIRQLLGSKFPLSGYYTNIYIEQIDFTNSLLYDARPFIYEGNNLLVGKNWAASNIFVSQYLPKSKQTINIFNGIFVKIKLPSPVKGYLIIKPIIVPDKKDIPIILQQLMYQYFTPKVTSITTGDTDFDNKFEVFCKPTKLQTQILNKKMLSTILDIEKKLQYCLNTNSNNIADNKIMRPALEISFTGNHIYVGVKELKLFSINENENEKISKCIEIIELISQLHTKEINK